MPGEMMKTLYATFDTREAADRAIEHLVQHYGIDRADVFVEAKGEDNSAGIAPSGGDVHNGEDDSARSDAALKGQLQVSVDLALADADHALAAFRDAGAREVSSR